MSVSCWQFTRTVNKALSDKLDRILLVNPTKYLGNLLLAGGLIQSWVEHCQAQNIACRIVLDESFRELCQHCFPDQSVIYFPRQRINKAGLIGKTRIYLGFLGELRAFGADLAFNIEEDSATSHLTRLSGAAFKLGCSKSRHTKGYDHVIPVDFENRPEQQRHRWYSYFEVFEFLGLPQPASPSYINLQLPQMDTSLTQQLQSRGVDFSRPLIALHAGATKDYKKWPLPYFVELCSLVLEAGMQPVLMGAGTSDRDNNRQILAALEATGKKGKVIDLCDQLSLYELALLLPACAYMIGNDSGPFHLGSAVGVHGSVIFGPTNKAIWAPLGKTSELIQGSFTCDPQCSKAYCLHEHQCLKEISPSQVFEQLNTALRSNITAT